MAEKTQFEVLWEKIRERLEKLVTPITYSTYFEGLEPTDVVNKKIVLLTTSVGSSPSKGQPRSP